MNYLINFLPITSIDASKIASHTKKDQVLSQLLTILQTDNLSDEMSAELRPIFNRSEQLSLQQGCILCTNRVVISSELRCHVSKMIYQGHPSIVRMKVFARN